MTKGKSIQDRYKMGNISSKRIPQKTPRSLIDEKGNANFGTFNNYIADLNILKCKKAVPHTPLFLNKYRAKQWQAFQIDFPDGFLLGAIYSVGYFMMNIVVYYDKNADKTTEIKKFSIVKKRALSTTLGDGLVSNSAGGLRIDIHNNLQDKKCKIVINYKKKNATILAAEINLEEISSPSVCVMPFAKNRPLYSHKSFFKATGKISLGEKTDNLTDARGIIDDHKGYYPRKMHYDWVTGIGKVNNVDIGFNLTDNQVLNKVDFNENYLWLNSELHPLPPIKIEHLSETQWHVFDEFDRVNLIMHIKNSFKINVNVGLVMMKYFAPFGVYTGYIHDLDGNKLIIDNSFGMGEDKTIVI